MAIKASNQISILDVTDGADGRSVSSITPEYYLSTSNTSVTGGSWSTKIPTWESGKYLWIRYKINYTNPSGTGYSSEVCDNSLNAMVAKGTLTDELNAELRIDGNSITVRAGDLIIDSDHLSLDANGNLVINTTGLTLDSSGNAEFTGNIAASSGEFTNGFSVDIPLGGALNSIIDVNSEGCKIGTYDGKPPYTPEDPKILSEIIVGSDKTIHVVADYRFALLAEITDIESDLTVGGVLWVQDPEGIKFGVNKVSLFDLIYPVGSIYMSVNNVNPSTLFGGTWVAWGSGRVPVGVNTNDSNFNTVEKTGGSSSVKLTANQIPSHTHDQYSINTDDNPKGGTAMYSFTSEAGTVVGFKNTKTQKNNIKTGSTGGGASHTNLQPYITCYMWKRTA